jgi:hypothetical protein
LIGVAAIAAVVLAGMIVGVAYKTRTGSLGDGCDIAIGSPPNIH